MADPRNSENEHAWVEERLSAYIDNQLAPLERAQFERHLRDCARCQRSLAALRWTVSLVKQAPAPALPRQFTLPVPAPKAQPRGMPAFGFGFARLATVVATLLLFAVVGIDVISRLGGTFTASAPAPAAQSARQPTSIALAPGQAKDQSKQPTPTAAATEKLFAAPTAAPLPAVPPAPASAPTASPTVIFGLGGGAPETPSTETSKSLAATAAPPRAPVLRASGTPTTAPLAGAASVLPTVEPTTTPQPTATMPLPTATATVPPPTATAQPSPTPQPTVAPFAQNQAETPQPVVTPIRATEIGLLFFAVFFGAVTVLLWRRR